ncbi:T9SS type A sorting domain-containing protein [Flavobacterium sp.]|uniref:T9SS type A sorting domain-containing protein n=1 Tax=Flavobacterium sp. TaxID=239 RepID=UPI00286DDC30|nr:T9SS type A sorting domain-containing protein [Flavobacterium sp.]
MYKYILLLVLASGFTVNGQNKIVFEYDTAGNQVKRYLCVSCPSGVGRIASETPKEITDLKPEDLQKFFPEDVISYYPNPVKEELYLKWELKNENKVSEIQVYSLSGQLIKTHSKLENKSDFVMPFGQYPSGIYNLILLYASGDQKAIKIIKE